MAQKPGSCEVCVSGLRAGADEEDLRMMFQEFGSIVSTFVGPEDSGSQRVGVVKFKTEQSASAAVAAVRGNHRGGAVRARLSGCAEASADIVLSEALNGGIRTPIPGLQKTGVVVRWKGRYGWIELNQPILHPLASKHEGRIFVDVDDLEGGQQELQVGDHVMFGLYADAEGLGASKVKYFDANTCTSSSSSSNPAHGMLSPADPLVKVLVEMWPPTLEDSFKRTFQRFGRVHSCQVQRPRQTGDWASGSVTFEGYQPALEAIKAMNGKRFGAKVCVVKFASEEDKVKTEEYVSKVQTATIGQESPVSHDQNLKANLNSVVPPGRYFGITSSWKGGHGWLSPETKIDHPSMSIHRGFIYVSVRDVEGGDLNLSPGSRVSFEFYSDVQGLGANKVRLEPNLPAERARMVGALGGVAAVSSTGSATGIATGTPCSSTPRAPERSLRSAISSVPLPEPAAPPPPPPPKRNYAKWWHELEGDCCPISLTPLEELEYEPFGLFGCTTATDAQLQACEGLWGVSAKTAMKSRRPVHWFDGKVLACSLVSKGHIMDPLSMRPLGRQECVSLDKYLAAKQLPAVHVAEAFDLINSSASENEIEKKRLATLSQEASTSLRMLDEDPAVIIAGRSATVPSEVKLGPPPPPPKAQAKSKATATSVFSTGTSKAPPPVKPFSGTAAMAPPTLELDTTGGLGFLGAQSALNQMWPSPQMSAQGNNSRQSEVGKSRRRRWGGTEK